MEEKNYFPSNLKYLRLKTGRTLKQLATYIGKTEATISRWESGERDITVGDICKVAEWLNVSVDELILRDMRFADNELNTELHNKINTLTDEQKQKVINMIDIIK